MVKAFDVVGYWTKYDGIKIDIIDVYANEYIYTHILSDRFSDRIIMYRMRSARLHYLHC